MPYGLKQVKSPLQGTHYTEENCQSLLVTVEKKWESPFSVNLNQWNAWGQD